MTPTYRIHRVSAGATIRYVSRCAGCSQFTLPRPRQSTADLDARVHQKQHALRARRRLVRTEDARPAPQKAAAG